jgi:hypothetical protein
MNDLKPAKIARMCTEKAAFLTKDEAKRMKHAVRKASGKKVSVYPCPNCRCYHFTSQTEQDG